LLDASPHKITIEQTVQIAREYDLVVLFTSTAGFASDLRLIDLMKDAKHDLKIAVVGPHVQVQPDASLNASRHIDFIVRGEFDHAVVDFARGRDLSAIAGVSYREGEKIVHNPSRPLLQTQELDALPFATEVYKRDLTIENYNVPFL